MVQRRTRTEAAGAAAPVGPDRDDGWPACQPEHCGDVAPIPRLAGCRTPLRLQLVVLNVTTPSAIDTAFETIAHDRIGALVIAGAAFLTNRREQILALATRHAVPAVYVNREAAGAGGLMSYGNSLADAYRRAGLYTARILKGEKPTDLPVDQATRFELIINLTTAKALGLEIPPKLLALADEVIE